MARRSRKSRSDAAGQTTAPASPFIKRSLPFFDILDDEKIEALERQVDRLIEEETIDYDELTKMRDAHYAKMPAMA